MQLSDTRVRSFPLDYIPKKKQKTKQKQNTLNIAKPHQSPLPKGKK